MSKKEFLCCFCGVFIQSNFNNLKRHEEQHKPHVSRIQCAAKDCGLTFCNKSYYWSHWTKNHSEMTMPDILIPTSEVKKMRKPYVRKAIVTVGTAPRNACKNDAGKSEKLNNGWCLTEIDHCENLNIRNIIEDCLVRSPFYGTLSDHNLIK